MFQDKTTFLNSFINTMQPSTYYHVFNHANDPENLFRCDENYHYFLRQWSKYIEPIAVTYAYCLMPNHIHFLIRTGILSDKEEPSKLISKTFSNLFNSYAKAYNKMYDRKGALFNRPFKAKEINSDEYLTNVIYYIHHNPVHHGFTDQVEDWPFSSYLSLVSDKPTKLNRADVQEWFGSKEELLKFHKTTMKELGRLELQFT